MSGAQHTPGPWSIHTDLNGKAPASYLIRADGTRLLLAYVNAADARLITAAPELLAALQQCREALRFGVSDADALAAAQAAIAAVAKATGSAS